MSDDLFILGEASWSPQTRLAGWAAYCHRGDASLIRSGPSIFGCPTSQQAEFMALANGLCAALRGGLLATKPPSVVLQSDCMEALSTLRWALGADSIGHVPSARRPSEGMRDGDAIATIRAVMRPLDCPLLVQHVKGSPEYASTRRECRDLARAARVVSERVDTKVRRWS